MTVPGDAAYVLDPLAQEWVEMSLTVGPAHLNLTAPGGGTLWVEYAKVSALQTLEVSSNGWHTVQVTYAVSAPEDPNPLTLHVSPASANQLSAAVNAVRDTPAPAAGAATLTLDPPMLAFGATLLGAVLLAIGAFLPWAVVNAGFMSVSVSGTDGDGILTLGAGLLIAILAVLGLRWWWTTVVAAVFGLTAFAVAVYDIWQVSDRAQDVSDEVFTGLNASVGIGLWATAFGAVVSVLGAGAMALMRAR